MTCFVCDDALSSEESERENVCFSRHGLSLPEALLVIDSFPILAVFRSKRFPVASTFIRGKSNSRIIIV